MNDPTTRTLPPDYLSHLGIAADPFASKVDRRFYYSYPSLVQRIELIKHIIEFSGQILLVTGDTGIGKTVMLEQVIARAPEHWRVNRLQANVLLNAPVFMQKVASGFGVVAQDGEKNNDIETCHGLLQQQLELLERAMQVSVLLVDDAHELPLDTFLLLFGLAQANEGQVKLHIALFARNDILEILDAPSLSSFKESVLHRLDIPPLDFPQTKEYLKERFHAAGITDVFPFSEADLATIFKKSGGSPGLINMHAKSFLAETAPAAASNPPDDAVNTPPLALAEEQTRRLSPDEEDDVRTDALEFSELINDEVRVTDAAEERPRQPYPRWQIGVVAGILVLLCVVVWMTTMTVDKAPVPEGRKAVELELPPIADTAKLGMEDTGVAAPEIVYVETPAADVADPGAKTAAADAADRPPPAIPAAQQKRARAPVKEPGPEPLAALAPQPAPSRPAQPAQSESKAIAAPQPKPAVTAPNPSTAPGPAKLPGVNSEAWLRGQPADHYVLQLFGAHDKAAVLKYLQKEGLNSDVAMFTTSHDGKDWHVVVYGIYPNRGAALAALSTLPAKLAGLNPWARSVASIHQAIGAAP